MILRAAKYVEEGEIKTEDDVQRLLALLRQDGTAVYLFTRTGTVTNPFILASIRNKKIQRPTDWQSYWYKKPQSHRDPIHFEDFVYTGSQPDESSAKQLQQTEQMHYRAELKLFTHEGRFFPGLHRRKLAQRQTKPTIEVPAALAAHPELKPKLKPGPKPNTGGFRKSDAQLYPVIKALMGTPEFLSLSAACNKIVDGHEVKGGGTPLSKSKRLADGFKDWLKPSGTD